MNSELSRIDINGVTYYIMDEDTRDAVQALQQSKLDKITQEQFNAIFT